MDSGDIRNIETTMRQFDAALNWMLDLGLEHATWMQEARDAIPFLSTVGAMEQDEFAEQQDKIEVAIHLRQEAEDFIRIHDKFATAEDAEVVRAKLKHVRRTSRSVLDEDEDGMPRNLMAELSYGAMIRQAGDRTDHSFDSDILWFRPGIIGRPPEVYSVEVKQPSSIRKLAQNVAKGAAQVQKAVDRSDPTFNRGCPHEIAGGIVVVICDRLIPRGRDHDSYRPRDEREARERVRKTLLEFAEVNHAALRAGFDQPATYAARLLWRPLIRIWHPEKRGRGIWVHMHMHHPGVYRQDPRWSLLHAGLENLRTWSPVHAADP